ncbi:DNA-protecting protein DprA [Sesbania bispinosa]|nr:DNA-protecting protein DprA [Sesbania bispinosa]
MCWVAIWRMLDDGNGDDGRCHTMIVVVTMEDDWWLQWWRVSNSDESRSCQATTSMGDVRWLWGDSGSINFRGCHEVVIMGGCQVAEVEVVGMVMKGWRKTTTVDDFVDSNNGAVSRQWQCW